jgi:8-oxo-dGTP diphosphatase
MPNTAPDAEPALRVVAGIILAPDADLILLARRPLDKHLGGLWEFPGGKLEPGETPLAGLARELEEELAIQVRDCAPFLHLEHDYGDRPLALDAWLVRSFTGVPVGNEGQEIAWIERLRLDAGVMPAANRRIAAALLAATREFLQGPRGR